MEIRIPRSTLQELVAYLKTQFKPRKFRYEVGKRAKYSVERTVFLDTIFIAGKFPRLDLYSGVQYVRNKKGSRIGAWLFKSKNSL
ncbi:hypothetical protein DRP04_06790 [Archaeoglobales archaeon]|nr:MAG: hypothetical protein DRP04_06790 [Archaeoglobales archaeon]